MAADGACPIILGTIPLVNPYKPSSYNIIFIVSMKFLYLMVFNYYGFNKCYSWMGMFGSIILLKNYFYL